MASVNKNKLLDNASKYLQKGLYDRAIKEFLKVLEADPNDIRVRLKLGDTYTKKQANTEAAQQYQMVAESYAKDGFFLKAVAVYNQILKLDGTQVEIHLKLGELYQQLGLLSDAMNQYQLVATHYDQKGMSKESADVLKKMAELDPENVAVRRKLAEINATEGQTGDALEEFLRIADDLRAKAKFDELAGVLEKIVALDPSNLDLVRELAGLYLDRGDPKRALAKLQICFRANPHELATLEMLAAAFVSLGQPEKSKSVYREIAHLHDTQGNVPAKMEAFRKILEIDPQDGEAQSVLHGKSIEPTASAPVRRVPVEAARAAAPVPGPTASSPTGAYDDPEVINKLLTEADVYLKYGLLEKALDHLRGIVRRNPNNVEAHLKLKEVYLQHKDADSAASAVLSAVDLLLARGERERAQEMLRDGLGFAPGHLGLQTRATELEGGGLPASEMPTEEISATQALEPSMEIDVGEGAGDAAPLIEAPGLPIENGDAIEIQVDDAEALVPQVPPAQEVSIDLAGIEEASLDDVPESSKETVSKRMPKARPVESPRPADVVELDSRRAEASKPAADPDQLLSELASAFENGQSAEEFTGSFRRSTKPRSIEERFGVDDVDEIVPPATAGARTAADRTASGFSSRAAPTAAGSAARAAPPAIPISRAEPSIPPVSDEPVPAELTDDVDEADFFLKQKIFDEAIAGYRRALRSHPGHPALTSRLARAEALARAAAAGVPVEREPTRPERSAPSKRAARLEESGGFDLAAELMDDLDGFAREEANSHPLDENSQVSLGDVVREARQRAGEQAGEDRQARYDLGIAYREMGLLDEAISEFELAAKSSNKVADCRSMIGLCQRDMGNYEAAIKSFTQSIKTPGVTDKQKAGYFYELAATLEAMGESAKAMAAYRQVQTIEPGFRDVARKLGGGDAPPANRTSKISFV